MAPIARALKILGSPRTAANLLDQLDPLSSLGTISKELRDTAARIHWAKIRIREQFLRANNSCATRFGLARYLLATFQDRITRLAWRRCVLQQGDCNFI
jgi:hypothetical protein